MGNATNLFVDEIILLAHEIIFILIFNSKGNYINGFTEQFETKI